ncbi:flagellar hook protein FlgE [Janthinobacterium sp. CG_23.3]|uniref:flagellar hook-basal body complex protein n=1 Tax=unclassified Janthinobacterium TaxID=2610881 RepID=UPI000347D129|nr:flagellar hook-basal body complex protein [Janthinobacterium sp. CG3]
MSFDIALSGIQAINEQLNTVSNNIANAGTYGFKSSRANFSSMYAGSKATGTEIGSLTQNIGLGGGVLNTGRGLDASINGRGFFVTRDNQNTMMYSRVGIFNASDEGYLINASGNKVQGYAAAVGTGALGPMGDLKVPTGQIPAVATTKLGYVANMSLDWPAPAMATFNMNEPTSYNMSKLSVVYDSLGAKHNVTQYFVKGPATNQVTVHYGMDGAAPTQQTTLQFNANGVLTSPPAVNVTVPTSNGSVSPIAVALNYTGTTQYAGEATTSSVIVDGYASGTYTGVELSENGSLLAAYTNGQKQNVGALALGTFANEGALSAVNDTSWVASTTSGTPLYDRPGTGMTGKLTVASLEQSNVDITSELVGLMTSQRNYQANSKVISTESTMLQSLMQAV